MNNIKKLLEQRTRAKKKKPLFRRKEIYRKKRLAVKWRKARGLDNKQRLHKKGAPPHPSIGYKSPRKVRGMHPSGLVPIIIFNVKQLDSLNKEQGIIISANVGNRKRRVILDEIKKKGLSLLNLDADKTVAKIQANLKKRQEERNKRLLEEKEKEKEKEKKKSIEQKVKAEGEKQEVQKEEDKKEELSDEEKKKLEKEEKDKLLIKRDQ
ncbi:50S ribosomal protein L32e [Candidatus Woesearchaeota archaeon]|nr:50S ribosomal protein L32e [Candidatus Woesearchaeota archaeon]